MEYIFALFLGAIYFTFFLYDYSVRRDILSPLCFFNFFGFLANIPNLMTSKVNYFTNNINESEFIFCYFLFQLLSVLLINIGVILFLNKSKKVFGNYQMISMNKKRFLFYSFFLMIIGIIANWYVIYYNGGLEYIFENIKYRTFFLRGFGYLLPLTYTITIACSCMLVLYCKMKKNIYLVIFLIMGVTSIFINSIFGGRAPVLTFLISLYFVHHYCCKKTLISDFFSIKYLIIAILFCSYMLLVPIVREAGNITYLYEHFPELSTIIIAKLSSISNELNLVDRDIFVYKYFYDHEFWLGRSFLDLFYALIPSFFLENKPPVDDGVYLANLMLGYNVVPNIAFDNVYFQSSIPFTSNGIMYANFGLVGIVIGSIFLSYVYSKAYIYLICKNKDFISVIMYFMTIYNFGLSNQMLAKYLPPIVVFVICRKLIKIK